MFSLLHSILLYFCYLQNALRRLTTKLQLWFYGQLSWNTICSASEQLSKLPNHLGVAFVEDVLVAYPTVASVVEYAGACHIPLVTIWDING